MNGRVKRSRDGCWTCRTRKKKCDGRRPACRNCEVLRLHCEGYAQRILWEDSGPRIGMRRRGPMRKDPQLNKAGPSLVASNSRSLDSKVDGSSMNDKYITSPMCACYAENRTAPSENDLSVSSENILRTNLLNKYRKRIVRVFVEDLLPASPFRFLSPYPLRLTPLQSMFLDHYLNNFSLKYPTYLDPSNPFLSTLVPLALKSPIVLCAVLAIGGIQTGFSGRPDVMAEILFLKGLALKGCRELIQRFPSTYLKDELVVKDSPADPEQHPLEASSFTISKGGDIQGRYEEDDLMLFAGVIMLMVQDKLSGEPCHNLRLHLKFARSFERKSRLLQVSTHYKFLRNIFLYNDLLASISSGHNALRDYGQDTGPISLISGTLDKIESVPMIKLSSNRYYLPILLSRIANRDDSVTLADIEIWDGNMSWLPSFSSAEIHGTVSNTEQQQPVILVGDEFENILISDIYRDATRVFYYQRLETELRTSHGSQPCEESNYDFQIQHFNSILLANLRLLPIGSAYESSLLLPIGIVAMEIRNIDDRSYVISRLQLLEDRFQLNQFRRFREKLSASWVARGKQKMVQKFACDAILLG